jgi:hypothetical protein
VLVDFFCVEYSLFIIMISSFPPHTDNNREAAATSKLESSHHFIVAIDEDEVPR